MRSGPHHLIHCTHSSDHLSTLQFPNNRPADHGVYSGTSGRAHKPQGKISTGLRVPKTAAELCVQLQFYRFGFRNLFQGFRANFVLREAVYFNVRSEKTERNLTNKSHAARVPLSDFKWDFCAPEN